MSTRIRESREISEIIDAGRKTGRANIEGTTSLEIQVSLMKSLKEFEASVQQTEPKSNVKGTRGVNNKKAHFGR